MIPAKILVAILRHDYGDPARGDSYEYLYFYRTLAAAFREASLFDYGPYLHRRAELQGELLRAAEACRPDVVFFVLFEEQFDAATLDRLRKTCTTVNWFCDDQWRYRAFSRRYAPHFSWVITTDPLAVDKYRADGYERAILSQWATHEHLPRFEQVRQPPLHQVSFVGGTDPSREWLVGELARRGVKVSCFGAGWQNGRVSFEQMIEIFERSRINLNLSNSRCYDVRFAWSSWRNFRHHRTTPKNREQVKGRHFEIPAWGGFQLAPYVEFLEDSFEIGREIAVYSTVDDLADRIGYYLAREPLREAIARAGHERVRRDHTYERRWQEIFGRMGLAGSGG
jgi:spore maturation protein CgeB